MAVVGKPWPRRRCGWLLMVVVSMVTGYLWCACLWHGRDHCPTRNLLLFLIVPLILNPTVSVTLTLTVTVTVTVTLTLTTTLILTLDGCGTTVS